MKNDLVVAYLQHGSSSIILSQKINWNEKILKWVWEKLKANNRSTENWKKNISPQWVGTRDRNTVMWHWSADTLVWDLSIDHNMDVYYQIKHWLQAPNTS